MVNSVVIVWSFKKKKKERVALHNSVTFLPSHPSFFLFYFMFVYLFFYKIVFIYLTVPVLS